MQMKIKDYFYSQEVFEVLPSKHEGILETFPKLSEEKLSEYYYHEKYISHQTQSKSLFDKAYQFAKRFMTKRKQKMVLKFHSSGRILDIGTGTGDFLKSFDPKRWEKYAIEPNEDLHQRLKENNISLLDGVDKIKNHKFDVITLWHALEHIPNLEETLQSIRESLTPNGILVIAVPNYKSFDAKFYKSFWAAWDVPRHVWHFSKQGLISLCQTFDLKFYNTISLPLDAFYISIVSEKYRKSNNIVRGFMVGLYSNVSGMFKNEYSSFVYVFKNTKQ